VLISCTEEKNVFPHNASNHEDPKIMKSMPAKSMKGMMVIERAEVGNNDSEGEMSTNQ
jgi:hypothetical protein